MNEDDLLFDLQTKKSLKVRQVAPLFHSSCPPGLFVYVYDKLCMELDETWWIMQFLEPRAMTCLTGYSNTQDTFFQSHHPSISLSQDVSTFPPLSITSFNTEDTQVSTGLDLVELSATGQWLTTEVLGKGVMGFESWRWWRWSQGHGQGPYPPWN